MQINRTGTRLKIVWEPWYTYTVTVHIHMICAYSYHCMCQCIVLLYNNYHSPDRGSFSHRPVRISGSHPANVHVRFDFFRLIRRYDVQFTVSPTRQRPNGYVDVLVDIGACSVHSEESVRNAIEALLRTGQVGNLRVTEQDFSMRELGRDPTRKECGK